MILFVTDALFSHILSKHNYSPWYIMKEKIQLDSLINVC